jgi:hypothetical protein
MQPDNSSPPATAHTSSHSTAPGKCRYPQSNATARPIREELAGLAANASACASFYLDTVEGMSNDFWSTEGEDHHQGLARSHRLSDGSIHFFLTHSELDSGDKGSVSWYRYDGPADGEHVLETAPLTVAPMAQLLATEEQHPADIDFLPDVEGVDGGYLFVIEEVTEKRVAVYRWSPSEGIVLQDYVFQGFPGVIPDQPMVRSDGQLYDTRYGPDFVFVDRVGDYYYLGVAAGHWGWGQLMRAAAADLFPFCKPGLMDVSAFVPAGMFPWPVRQSTGASQAKLVRDSEDKWFLLAFHSDPPDDPNGTDYIDLHGVRFEPFAISYRLEPPYHLTFKPGDTGFASTGTRHVEPSGRLLVSSSYRWAKDELPGGAGYVSRVDELPSA